MLSQSACATAHLRPAPAREGRHAQGLIVDAKRIAIAAKKMRRRMGLPPAPAAEPIADIIARRAERVKALVEANFGKVLFRTGDKVVVEIPADVSPGMPGARPAFRRSTSASHSETRRAASSP
jgi:hypothetical protein